MLNYAVVEILGRQYKVAPESVLTVDFLGEVKKFECDKVLLEVKDGQLAIGTPFLKDKLTFQVVRSERGPKIRVATYKAKSNYRRVKGARSLSSIIKLVS